MIRQSPESSQWFRRVSAKLTNMSAARSPVRMCRPDKGQERPVLAGVTVRSGISSRVPEAQRSSKVQVSQDIGTIMGIPPLPGRDISSRTSKTGKVSSISRSISRRR
jgi:hypothetical protein